MGEYEDRIGYLENLARELLQERQQMAQQFQIQQIAVAIRQRAKHLRKTNPEFMKAIEKHIRRPRINDLKQLGLSEAEAAQRADAELDSELIQYTAQGVDPFELAFKTVQTKGWKPSDSPEWCGIDSPN